MISINMINHGTASAIVKVNMMHILSYYPSTLMMALDFPTVLINAWKRRQILTDYWR